ncbi:alpha-D-ribose 1-methylphosphonate 5-triphosphate diphosphatase [Pelagibius sp. Alg239-R121]|uniref:alpha-D-ribose 1-methylphosphonate 5-triphosphate diphosphatase n=1 Tax=Pelagibius sp. Alg239-R121 TaxID=2993448 RepID=UPI0024A71700|nr:alpha-D-ribose 1-methylphosphonate 5-triphosphate diphosphatase [Pelagibius sp. Alg239-R121]
MTMETLFTNAKIVTADEVVEGTVAVEDGRIKSIEPGNSQLPSVIDLEGDYLVPGLIEVHTDNLEGHIRPRPGVVWPMLPALFTHDSVLAAAGITTVFDALRIGDRSSDVAMEETVTAAIEGIEQAQDNDLLRSEHYVHLRCELATENVLSTFGRIKDAPLLRLVSLMDHTPGQRQFVDLAQFKNYYSGKYKMNDEELNAFIDSQQQEHLRYADKNRQALSGICNDQSIPLASHDDATEDHIKEADSLGITISEFPTTLEAARAAHDSGMATVAGAPNVVRGRSHSGNVSASELAEKGLLDSLSSDYAPISLLHGAFCLHRRVGLTLPDAMAIVTKNPARMVALDDRGEIAPGLRADLVRVCDHKDMPVVRCVWREGVRVV